MPLPENRNDVSQSNLSAHTWSSEEALIEDDSETYAGSVSQEETESCESLSNLQRLSSKGSSPRFYADVGDYKDDGGDFAVAEQIQSPNLYRLSKSAYEVHDSQHSPSNSSGSDLVQADPGQIWTAAKEIVKQEKEQLDPTTAQREEKGRVMKLSPAKIHELTSAPKSLPSRSSPSASQSPMYLPNPNKEGLRTSRSSVRQRARKSKETYSMSSRSTNTIATTFTDREDSQATPVPLSARSLDYDSKPHLKSRTVSTPLLKGKHLSSKVNGREQTPLTSSSAASSKLSLSMPPLKIPETRSGVEDSTAEGLIPSPMPQSIPAPPLSLPTYLQLELSSSYPSPLYIHRSVTSDFPYESSRVKIERLQNFLLLPFQLEQVLWFGALACLDAWLFSFTILPLRFLKALSILTHSWGSNLSKEVRLLWGVIYSGTGRLWRRRLDRDRISRLASHVATRTEPSPRASISNEPSTVTPRPAYSTEKQNSSSSYSHPGSDRKHGSGPAKKHHRSKSTPSALLPDHKADILKGLLILMSCSILMYFDASRMYHGIRGQAAIKLYVIYNVLEVCDRLFSALGQDVLECLFSKETLERKPDGRSKVLRPFWLFILALFYSLVHATSLFYQVITLNVAVNSYSNALLTLLMSNQFVEIKSTVFKKFEKENLFQLTCADVVERFQLWLMLIIIASRNIIETGGLSLGLGGSSGGSIGSDPGSAAPLRGSRILTSFTMLPAWTEQVLGPFLLVLGSEMLVDWIKHAYITKFNNTKPAIYGRFLDVLAKDYYSNAFADQNLTRRLGLPVIPLASLFIRASVQTYHMVLATHMPLPIPSSATSLSVESATASNPAATAALQHIDYVVRRALGRSTFGAGALQPSSGSRWTTDDAIAFGTMILFFSVLFLVLLAFKLLLGMCLLSFARNRYKGMKEREHVSVHADGKRVGGWGVVEVSEDKRRWIYKDDPEGARRQRDREEAARRGDGTGDGEAFGAVSRYSMVAKRIW
ncbi:hypothetical protein MMC07_008362 [Pseudocyphellaria aurata]|nr:hypothetical protein [Pseudocyphellaria aurata]